MKKTSYYNLYIPIEEENIWLVYNINTGGLYELTDDEGQIINKWSKLERINNKDYQENLEFINKLLECNLLVDTNLDEVKEAHKFYLDRKKRMYYEKRPDFLITLVPTTDCNMDCEYCYVTRKDTVLLNNKEVDQIINLLDKEVKSNKYDNKCNKIKTVWIGGEPTLNKEIIKYYTERIKTFCKDNELEYTADIITNGVLLDESWIELLKDANIVYIQITIDGPKELHERSRPLKTGGENYERIISNIKKLSNNFHITIRINSDRTNIHRIDELLHDLEVNEIWPSKNSNLNVALALKRKFGLMENIISEESQEQFINDYKEHFEFIQEFRELKLKRFNNWAKKNGLPTQKKKWIFPRYWVDDCNLAASPNGFVFSPGGYVYKCDEVIDKKEYRVGEIKNFNNENEINRKWIGYDRFTNFKKCKNCKFILRCQVVYCVANMYKDENEMPCCSEKFYLKDLIKKQYLESLKNSKEMETIEEFQNRQEEHKYVL